MLAAAAPSPCASSPRDDRVTDSDLLADLGVPDSTIAHDPTLPACGQTGTSSSPGAPTPVGHPPYQFGVDREAERLSGHLPGSAEPPRSSGRLASTSGFTIGDLSPYRRQCAKPSVAAKLSVAPAGAAGGGGGGGS